MDDPTTQSILDLVKRHGPAGLVPLVGLAVWRLFLWFAADWQSTRQRDSLERTQALQALTLEREKRVAALERELAEEHAENLRLCERMTDLESQLHTVLEISLNDARQFRLAHEKLQAEHSAALLELAKQSHIRRTTTPNPR